MPRRKDGMFKGTKDFTREQKLEIVKRSAQVGSRQTANEFGTSWQAVLAIQRKFEAQGGMLLTSNDTLFS